jgi:polysaccharide pyruvyl transferase WcaK-like protein
MNKRKVTVYGHFGVQNLGNECTLQAIIHNLSRYLSDADFQCLSTVPEDTAARHNVLAFRARANWPDWLRGWINCFRERRKKAAGPRREETEGGIGLIVGVESPPHRRGLMVTWLSIVLWQLPKHILHWVRGFWIMKGSDLLVIPGTGVVADYLTGPFSYPYDIFKWSTIARLCGARVLFVGIGAGPILHPLSRWFLRTSLSCAQYRSYRDTASKQCVKEIGVNVNSDSVCPDLAFGLPRGLFTTTVPQRNRIPMIGVGLKDYAGLRNAGEQPDLPSYQEYLETMTGFVSWLCQRGYGVRVLIGDGLYDTGVVRDFMHLCKIRGLEGKQGKIIYEPVVMVQQLLAQLSMVDIVISPRFHNLVLALMLNKPVIALSDHQKLDSLMQGFGLVDYCLPLPHLTVENLGRKLLEVEMKAEGLKLRIKEMVEQYRRELEREYAAIFSGGHSQEPVGERDLNEHEKAPSAGSVD